MTEPLNNGRVPNGTGLSSPTEPCGLGPAGFDPSRVIQRIAQAAHAIGWQAGVGGMETAGSIVSFLAANPERVAPFLAGEESPCDWDEWLHNGCLTWQGQSGKIVTPEEGRRARLIKKMEKGA
jgi:hypothetical protein